MKAAIKFQGKVCGIAPHPVHADGDGKYPVYADRAKADAWEVGELTAVDEKAGTFIFEWPELVWDGVTRPRRTLSATPKGPESRPANTRGPWEVLFATEQPDKHNLAYRFHDGALLAYEVVLL